MYVLLLVLRTAIGVLSAILVWVVIQGFLPAFGPLLGAVAAGFAGGTVCMSLGPSIGQQLAAIAGLVTMALAFGTAWEPLYPHNWVFNYWPLWILPAFVAGAATWLLIARALQRDGGA